MAEAYIYKISQEELQFQDSVMEKLNNVGIHVQLYSSKKYQWTRGESICGVEVKHDKKMKSTGNLYIEYAEKDRNNNWCDSGIIRQDNSWLYCIGNEEQLFLIPKNTLIQFKEQGKVQHVETSTSKGFLLPMSMARKFGHVI